jgi:Holliday junction resolvasome RuvABC ATP-dependent DNA helicase subunit
MTIEKSGKRKITGIFYRLQYIPTGQRTKNVVSVDLNPFTLIGAPTHVGRVSPPLRDRFIALPS